MKLIISETNLLTYNIKVNIIIILMIRINLVTWLVVVSKTGVRVLAGARSACGSALLSSPLVS
jgi:hypothetical protein